MQPTTIRQILFLIVTCISFQKFETYIVNGQGTNPPCYFCNSDPDATISNPLQVIDLTDLGDLVPVSRATCSQIVSALEIGTITEAQCKLTQTDSRAIAVQIECGCSTISTLPPIDITASPSPTTVFATSMPTIPIVASAIPTTTSITTSIPTTISTTVPTLLATSLTTSATADPTSATTMTDAPSPYATPTPTSLVTDAQNEEETSTPTTVITGTPQPSPSITIVSTTLVPTLIVTTTTTTTAPIPTALTISETTPTRQPRTRTPKRPPSVRTPIRSSQRTQEKSDQKSNPTPPTNDSNDF